MGGILYLEAGNFITSTCSADILSVNGGNKGYNFILN